MYKVLGLALLLSAVCAKHEIYEGYSVFEVTAKDLEQTKLVNRIESQLDLDVWSHSLPGRPGFVLVPGEKKAVLQNALSSIGIEYKVEVENVKEHLELEDRLLEESRNKPNRDFKSGLPIDSIYSYDEIDAYLESLARDHSNIVTLVNAGKTHEGRDIKYLKISTTNFEDKNKPVVFIESLLHAREWVGQPATLTAIKKLVFDVTDSDALRDIDWIVLPIANPDGYENTRNSYRYWRKNLAKGLMIGNFCSGVDLNRNFDVNWSQASSNFVCTDTYHGPSPASEPETQVIQNIINENIDRMELFIDIHSFGSMILYGYGNGTLPSNGLIIHLAGVEMAKAIDAVKESWNPNYIVGNVALVLYDASGSVQDYAQSVGVPLSYTYELPARRYGAGTMAGFLVDTNFIEQAGLETWQGILAGARFARNSFRMRRGLY